MGSNLCSIIEHHFHHYKHQAIEHTTPIHGCPAHSQKLTVARQPLLPVQPLIPSCDSSATEPLLRLCRRDPHLHSHRAAPTVSPSSHPPSSLPSPLPAVPTTSSRCQGRAQAKDRTRALRPTTPCPTHRWRPAQPPKATGQHGRTSSTSQGTSANASNLCCVSPHGKSKAIIMRSLCVTPRSSAVPRTKTRSCA
jgi:hypothetical protein